MAIKVSGITVINDSGNIENVGTFTATSFVGNGSGLTNIPLPAIAQPSNISPASGTTGLGATFAKITLTASGYISFTAHNMAAAQWQVSTVSSFTSTVISTGDVAGTSTSYDITPTGTLNPSTTYYWRVRYKNTNGVYSEWSSGTSFTTASSFQPSLGSSFQGGYYIGMVGSNAIIIAPKASGQSAARQWKTENSSSPGTSSTTDGWTNTNNMNNSLHPAASYTRGLSISGYTDWYLPAKDELNLAWTNRASLPSGETNNGGGYANPYWSSTEYNSSIAWNQDFNNGTQAVSITKVASLIVRAVRRVAF